MIFEAFITASLNLKLLHKKIKHRKKDSDFNIFDSLLKKTPLAIFFIIQYMDNKENMLIIL